jgi:Ca2+-transporting ATPase
MGELLPWHHMEASDVLRSFASRPEGLDPLAADRLLQKQGKNGLAVEPKTKTLQLFFRQFTSPLLVVLAFAALLSAVLAHWSDVSLILIIILMNVFLGFFQEYKADKALQELRAMLPLVTKVRRGGKVIEIPSGEIVPGDICLFISGDKITADGRIISATSFSTNESALTGESREVEKSADKVATDAALSDQTSMVFAGTVATEGKAEVIVTATGSGTAFGKIASMVSDTVDEETPLQRELRGFSRKLAILMSGIAGAVFLLGLIKGLPPLSILTIAAALAVAAVPEGVLMSLTVILAVGMRRMLARKALVRRMVAAETLGSVSVMCVDKTGTLTTGSMAVAEVRYGARLLPPPYEGGGQGVVDPAEMRIMKESLSRLIHEDGVRLSLTEKAAATFLEGYQVTTAGSYLDEVPFNSSKKYSAKLWQMKGEKTLYAWGAPEVLLKKADIDDVKLSAFHKILNDMTGRGLRVLFIGKRTAAFSSKLSDADINDLEPIGFIGFEDPLRPHSKQTIADAFAAGVRTVMVTGDHPATASRIASELGLSIEEGSVVTGPELATMSDEELKKRIERVSVFARVLPEQKVRIVQALKRNGHVVAMTGDGVNDAPALKAADIGVAVGSGTDVAKETADMVILDNDVASIVAAIHEGRVIFENIRKVILFLLTFSLGEVAVISGAIILGLPLPFTPLHILWINLLTDGLPAMALAFEPGSKLLMREKPRNAKEMIVAPHLRNLMLTIGSVTVTSLIISLALGADTTFLFLSLGFDSLFAIFVVRNLRESVFKIDHRQNVFLLLSFALSFGLLLLPVYEPHLRSLFGFVTPDLTAWKVLASLTLIKFLLFEIGKKVIMRPVDNHFYGSFEDRKL